ncbi:prephenate dehydrogenase/arogenate dehydrogenase family protein [candidate division KSB1 bacterium]|nr:prephenate dehydrogenase/arogenate dehydrogenase family protein [candidate division KSB1 bacterium]
MEKISKVAIIGLGVMGGSIGLSIKQRKLCEHVVGVDEFSVIHNALDRGAIDEGFDKSEMQKALESAEIVFICTPINQILDLIQQVSAHVSPNTIVCDVGSTKSQIVDKATKHFKNNDIYFIGSHPMAGSEMKGIEAADHYLFENVVWVLTPHQKMPDTSIRKLGTLLENIGAKVLMLSPEQHDKIAAAVSHLPQLLAISLTNMIARFHQENPNYIRLAAGGFRDMTRIASSPYSIWKDIIRSNVPQIETFIDEFIKELQQTKKDLKSDRIEHDFEKANVTRLAIPKDTKGFMKPTYDISVGVEDKPGVIAVLSTTLADNNINIKDIEVLKVREGEGGTIRMSFSTWHDRSQAIELITEQGFSCYSRD